MTGLDPETLKGSNTGFFFGSCFQETHCEFDDPTKTPAQIRTLVTRVSRHFQFKGPIVQTDSACGSSASALAEAFIAMKSGICDQIICAGSNTLFRPRVSLQFRDLKMITKDGKCKCLDSGANGYVRSEACVVFLLQKREDAQRIYCTILNAKSNSDGYKVEGITFPSITGQKRLVSQVYKEVGVDPSTINYIEAHVTGTKAGDPVEMNAMYEVICEKKTAKNPLYVGCLKSNMGHTEGASGLCALAKACIIFQNKKIPPNLHFQAPNPNIKGLMDNKMIPVNKVIPFTGSLIPINCFGFGGANVHVLTEMYDRALPDFKITSPIPRIIQLCGRTVDSIHHFVSQMSKKQSQYLTPDFLTLLNNFATLPYKKGMNVRAYAIVTERNDGINFNIALPQQPEAVRQKPFTFVFTDAADCLHSFKDLKQISVFSNAVGKMQRSLRNVGVNFDTSSDTCSQKILQSVAVQIGLVDIMFSLGIKPDGILSYGLGILAAAYADDTLSLEEAILSAYHYSVALTNKDSQFLTNKLSDLIIFPKQLSHKFKTYAGGNPSSTPVYVSGEYLATRLLSGKRVPEIVSSFIPLDSINFVFDPVSGLKERGQVQGSCSPIMNLLHSVGKMYMNGSNGRVTRLYPAVELPLPSSTATLSPLIKWNHEKVYPLTPFLIQSTSYHFQTSKDMMFHFDRRQPEDTFLFDHKIDGRVLFPATGYLMMAWSAFARLNNVCVYDCPIEFRDVSFERATVMNSTERNKLTIRINEDSGVFTIKEGENLVAKGSVRFHSVNYNEPIALRLDPPPEDLITLESKDLYREFRIRGYDYGQYFQGLNDTRSDGRSGNIIWRDVLSNSFKESMSLETDEDQSLLWLRSWITFSDAMFQLLLMSRQDISRNLFVPRKIESVICFPEILRQNINDSPKYLDSMTLSDASNLTAFADPDENIVWVKGLVMKGLKTSLLKRRQQYVRHKKYYYAPNNENITLDSSKDIRRLEQYYETCTSLAKRINNKEMGSFIETPVDPEEEQHALLRLLVHKFKGGGDITIDMSKDLLIGKTEDDWFFPEHFLKPHFERIVYNSIDGNTMKLDVLEFSQSNYVLTKAMTSFADESLLYDQTVFNYSLMHPSPIELDPSVTSNIKEIHKLNDSSFKEGIPAFHIILYRCPEENVPSQNDLSTLMESFAKAIRDSGFLLMVAKDKLSSKDIESCLSRFNTSPITSIYSSSELEEAAVKAGFQVVSRKTLMQDILPLKTILMKKKIDSSSLNHHTVAVGLTNYNSWLPILREKLEETKNDPNSRIWLVPEYDSNAKDKVTGLMGFVKSIRLESGYNKIRLLMDMESSKPDIFDPKYGDLLKMDLVYNIFGGEKIGWVQYEHLCLPRNIQDDEGLKDNLPYVYLKTMKPGDLTSLSWAQSDFSSICPSKLATVYYAPLNFRDIMFATGRLQPEAIPGIPSQVAQDSILGLEFAGKDVNGNRVMGVVPYKAIASTVVMSDADLVWPIPKDWSMEEASTVPCVYATAYYALIIRGAMTCNEVVLVHAGAGGVGLAAISICLSLGCRVFTTVGSSVKRQYLLKQFPQLQNSDILYSRDSSFEDDIMKATEGRGVDIILNSLAEEKLRAGLRCLAPNGRFLEIGKVDFIQDNPLFAQEMDMNRSFHGVLLDSLFRYSSNDYFPRRLIEEKKKLKMLVMQGIDDGTVRPLKRTIFEKERIEEAFRYMSSGKHIGKVVIQMKDESQDLTHQTHLPAIKFTHLSPNKSYIVIGGLGGFGLEVVTWLADKGAKKIVISARRGIREPYQQFCVNRLKKRGVQLNIAHEPVHTEEGAQTILNKALEMGPLGGLLNTAVVYEDVMFENMTNDQFNKVIEPKLLATLHFDKLTRQQCPNLDFFVTFSSISCGRGNGGQTNYNFANSAMDSICENRFSQGLPALSIQWGVVGDVGIVTEKTGSTEVNLLGATSQRLHSLLEACDRFLQTKSPVCLSYVKAEKTGSFFTGDSVDLLKMVSRIFGIKDISTLDPLASLGSLGIDSLIAVEMKQLLERATGISMSVKEIRDLTISTLIDLSKSQAKVATSTT